MTSHEDRVRRLADRIKVIIAEMLEKRIKDPRLGFVTVTDVRLTNDMREATVFYTVLGEDVDREATAAALESAKGHLRTEVGRITGVRFAPSLTFVLDALPETAAHIEDLLKQAAASDAEVQERAASARYAGSADPYRSDEADAAEQ
ncbi:MAG: 30S ribosome-binding factor RbfA [Candidatus Nanopelagicales bacterium]